MTKSASRIVPSGQAASGEPGRSPGPDVGLTSSCRSGDVAILIGLLGLAYWVGYHVGAFRGFPQGADTLDHITTTKLLLNSFPHILWNPSWFGGMPSVPGLYPPLYAFMVDGLSNALGTSISHAVVLCSAGAYLVITVSAYGFVRVIAKSRVAGILASLITIAVPALWAPALLVGEYPRLTGMAFSCLATFLAALYTAKHTRVRLAGAAFLIGCALACHPLTGGLGAIQVLGVMLFVPYRPRRERIVSAAGAGALKVGLALWLYLPRLLGVNHGYYMLAQATFTPSDPIRRRQAIAMLRGTPLAPVADLLLGVARGETDVGCRAELRSLVSVTQWEPLGTPELRELRARASEELVETATR